MPTNVLILPEAKERIEKLAIENKLKIEILPRIGISNVEALNFSFFTYIITTTFYLPGLFFLWKKNKFF